MLLTTRWKNYYYENRRDGTFADKALELGVALGQNGQGVLSTASAVSDLDGGTGTSTS